MTGANPLPDGTATYCAECGEPYREIHRLPGMVGRCPTCFEKLLGGEKNE